MPNLEANPQMCNLRVKEKKRKEKERGCMQGRREMDTLFHNFPLVFVLRLTFLFLLRFFN